jgi:hypothetical protein
VIAATGLLAAVAVATLWLSVLLLAVLSAIVRIIYQEARKIMSKLDDLTAAVAAEKTATASAIALLEGLKTKLDAAILADDDGAALEALSAELGANTTALAAAVVANTPAAVVAGDATGGATSSAHPDNAPDQAAVPPTTA